MDKKKFIVRAKEWHICYLFGTIEEMRATLNALGIEFTEIVDIAPKEYLGVTFNRCIKTKMKVIGFDEKAQQSFLAEYKQLVEKYSTSRKHKLNPPKFQYGDVEWFFKERPIETDAIDVLIADNTTFRREYFDEERGTKVVNLSSHDYYPCSDLSEEHLWWHLAQFCGYERP